jgi:hypothetical protein
MNDSGNHGLRPPSVQDPMKILTSAHAPGARRRRSPRLWTVTAVAAYAVLCIAVLSIAAHRMEPDDSAYRGSIVAITEGRFLSLSTAQVHALAARVDYFAVGGNVEGPIEKRASQLIPQWVRRADGRWISEKDPGYPFLAAPFQALGIIRLAPLFYGALGCLGLFAGARRWLGARGAAMAVCLFCFSGAALFFAWDDYMPAFTDASLIAAGTGALLWAVLAEEAAARLRIRAGLLGFLAIEAAVFVRYTNIVVLGCAVVAAAAARWLRAGSVPPGALRWWIGSVGLFGAGLATFDSLVYGGPFTSGYRPGEVTFSLGAILLNLRYVPAHLIYAMPMLVLGLAGLGWIALRRARLAGQDRDHCELARRDLAVGFALAASWFSVWALYAAYTWTAQPGLRTFAASRFYLPAAGAISLLGAWVLVRGLRRRALAAAASAAVVAAMFGMGLWSFTGMVNGG